MFKNTTILYGGVYGVNENMRVWILSAGKGVKDMQTQLTRCDNSFTEGRWAFRTPGTESNIYRGRHWRKMLESFKI